MSEEQKEQSQLISDDMWIYDWAQIDKGVIYCKDISDSEFRTYCVIRSLVNQRKSVAWPSVETIAELSGHSKRTAQRNIESLQKKDLVQRILRPGTSNYYMVKKIQNSSVLRNEQDIQEWMENHPTQEEKKPEPPKQPKEKKDDHVPYKAIIGYLNEKANTKYSHTGQANQKLVKARYNELAKSGLDALQIMKEFESVIDVKVSQWVNTDMSQYLRPSTLFGNKFDQYRNESPNRKTFNQTGQASDDRFSGFLNSDD